MAGSPEPSPGPTRHRQRPLEILVVDDEAFARIPVVLSLRAAGHRVLEAADGLAAAHLVAGRQFDLVVSDVRLPKLDGLALLRRIRVECPSTAVILMTAYANIPDAVDALREGAYDYVTKPLDPQGFTLGIVRRLGEERALRQELQAAHRLLEGSPHPAPIIGSSPPMLRLFERLSTMAQSDAPVLLCGDSGTGKELVARALHDQSLRKERPFVAVNCAAFPHGLLEAELFGHERGAFTGAVKRRQGRFQAADGGTLLLDEVAEIPLLAQAKLLRVLQEGTVEPLGSDTSRKVDVRIISATHQNLKELVAHGRFREDLYYRLKVLELQVPPLRERKADLPLLIGHFLRQVTRPGVPTPSISPRAWAALLDYAFPGNVRELAHAIEHACVLCGGAEIGLEHLPHEIGGHFGHGLSPAEEFATLGAASRTFEREYLLRALSHTGGRRDKTAALLGISRKTLWEKLRSHGISDEDLPE